MVTQHLGLILDKNLYRNIILCMTVLSKSTHKNDVWELGLAGIIPYLKGLITGLNHAKLVSLTSPCCSGCPAPMNTPQGQQRELSSDGCADFNVWLESDLVLIINFNSTHKYHTNPHTWHMIYITCYFLIIGTGIKFNHTNSAIHSSGHSHSLWDDVAASFWRNSGAVVTVGTRRNYL